VTVKQMLGHSHIMYTCCIWIRGVVTALKPVRAEQVRRPERKQNWTMPHCGSVLPICLSLRPVGPIHIIIETVSIIFCSPRADIGGPNCQSITPLIIWNIFIHFSALSFNSIFNFFDWSGPIRVLVPSYRSPCYWYGSCSKQTIAVQLAAWRSG